MNLALSIPLGIELLNIGFHKGMALFRHSLTCSCIHPVFQQKQLFVKMIDGRIIIELVLLHGLLQVRWLSWIIQGPVFESAIIESPGNTDGSNCIQAIRILYN